MLKRFTATAAAVLLIVACTDTSVQPTPADIDLNVSANTAVILDGTPGRYTVDFAIINMSNGWCRAEYLNHNGQNSTISNRGQGADVHVTMNKKWIHATCKFQDLSGAYDDNAEVGDIQFCRLRMEDGTVYNGGTGTVTSAMNFSEEAVDPHAWGSGGNTMIRCKIPNEPQIPT